MSAQNSWNKKNREKMREIGRRVDEESQRFGFRLYPSRDEDRMLVAYLLRESHRTESLKATMKRLMHELAKEKMTENPGFRKKP